jgi:hypothetical protein
MRKRINSRFEVASACKGTLGFKPDIDYTGDRYDTGREL